MCWSMCAYSTLRCPNMEVAQCETNAEQEEEEDDMDKKAKMVSEGKSKRKIKWVHTWMLRNLAMYVFVSS